MKEQHNQLKENICRHLRAKYIDVRTIPEKDLNFVATLVLKRYEQGNTLEESLEIGERVLEVRID